MEQENKTILMAGATGGLGRAVTMQLAADGYSLMLIHQKEDEKFESLRSELKATRCRHTFYRCDFTNSEEIQDAIEIFFEQEKQPYALVNLIGSAARVDWQNARISQLQDSFLLNASAPLHSAKIFGLKLKSAKASGAIVLFSSMQGVYPFEGSLYYGAPKAALIHGAKILAKDFGGDPFVRVNVIAPGVNQAGMAEESIKKGKYAKFVEQKIVPRYGEASDAASLVQYLVKPDLYMTGQALLLDGGLSLRKDLLR